MVYPSEELVPFKMASIIAPFDLVKYFQVSRFQSEKLERVT